MSRERYVFVCFFIENGSPTNEEKQHEHREKPNEREKTTDLVGVVYGFKLLRLRHTVSYLKSLVVNDTTT